MGKRAAAFIKRPVQEALQEMLKPELGRRRVEAAIRQLRAEMGPGEARLGGEMQLLRERSDRVEGWLEERMEVGLKETTTRIDRLSELIAIRRCVEINKTLPRCSELVEEVRRLRGEREELRRKVG